MIVATVKFKGGRVELAKIKIINESESSGEVADYSIEFAVHTAAGIALYQRSIYGFPRKKLNALALLLQALNTLAEEELSLDADPDAPGPPDLVGRLLGPL